MKKAYVLFSRTYNVMVELPDDATPEQEEAIADKAIALVIDNDPRVTVGRLEMDGWQDWEPEDGDDEPVVTFP
jgi:hypothetical protein